MAGRQIAAEQGELLLRCPGFAGIDDEIGVASNTGGRSTYTNVGSTRREGAEAAFKWNIAPQWRTQLAVTALKAHYLDNFNATTRTETQAWQSVQLGR